MEVILSSLVAIPTQNLTPELSEELKSLAIRENPDWREMKRRGYVVNDEDQYTLSYHYIEEGKYLCFTRGLWDQIRDILDARSISYTVSDRRTSSPPLKCLLKWDIDLFKYQDKALNELVKGEDGILVADCGAGKTVIGSAIISKINQRTLIVVTTLEIKKQWVDSIAKFTDYPKSRIGHIGGGRWEIKPITVATFQSLGKIDNVQQKEINAYFGCMLLDECHHNSANLLFSIANKIRVKHKYGLTATPNRKDKKEFMVFNSISHRIINITSEELEAEGRSIIPSVRFIEFPGLRVLPTCNRWNGKARVEEVAWSKFYSELAADESRNKIICDNIISTVKEGHKCLVLSNRVEQCHTLYTTLKNEGLEVGLILGSQDKNDRSDIMKRARAGDLDAVIATNNLAAEGLDIPVLSCVHIFVPTANKPFIKQATGRVRRPYEGKEALVVDYHDVDVDPTKDRTLLSMFMCRVRLYHELKYLFSHDDNTNESKVRLI